MADWTLAPCIAAALAEANHLWPNRNRASDGTIGDAAHAATVSDHNPDERGVVHAFDLTHDPAHGVDCHQLAAGLVDSRDHRVRYLIFDRRILLGPWSDSVRAGKAQPWVWKPYDGSSPHTDHLHVSVGYDRGVEGDTSPWWGAEEDDMALTDDDVKRVGDHLVKRLGADATHPYTGAFIVRRLATLEARVSEGQQQIIKAVQAIQAGDGATAQAIIDELASRPITVEIGSDS